MWQNSLKSSILPSLTDLYLLLHSLKQIRANHYILSPGCYSQLSKGELCEGLGLMISVEKNSEVDAVWDHGGWGIVSKRKEQKNPSFLLLAPHPALPFLNQTGQSMEKLSGMGWRHIEKGRRRDKMAPGMPSSSVVYGSRRFPPRILSPRGRSYLHSSLCWRFLTLLSH